ncbi:MAG: glycoside hydrolase family 32 protein [Planctomycetota bacterium]|nr:glycoside hydrolase family 32 protein [Planctomycetota bacterium]MDA1141556.1 glycoside hydrolase family 32 protein [Planctomycetota bacterium]
MSENIKFPSKLPQRAYSEDLNEQMGQLENDELVLRFTESRQRLSSDPFRPAYHFVNPEGRLNDPNGLCFWQGRFHLFYQAYPPEDPRQHWGHAFSEDLVHWQDLPLAIFPGIEEKCFSGSTFVEEDRVIAMYHGTGAGNMVAVSDDPLLLNWEKIPGNPVVPMIDTDSDGRPYRVYDPCIWSEKDGYFSLSGTYVDGPMFGDCRAMPHLFFSQDMSRWSYCGPFVEGDIFTQPGEDCAVPYFWPIGNKHILIFASHQRGSQYLLGDYDRVQHRFHSFAHGRFNFGPIAPGGVHAPSATPDGRGGIYVIHNINAAKPTAGWDHIMSVVRRLTLREDLSLGIEPVGAIESLRGSHHRVKQTALPANEEIVIDAVEGNVMEIEAVIETRDTREICLRVLRSPGAEEHTDIKFYRNGHFRSARGGQQAQRDALVMDSSRSSLAPDILARPPEIAPFDLGKSEVLKLRVFIDRSVVEVFANSRQCLALRVYPERKDSLGVSLRAQGREALLRSLDVWQMKSSYLAVL